MSAPSSSTSNDKPFVIDADRHVQEAWRIFQDYAEPAFRERVYSRLTMPDGSQGLALDGRPLGLSAAMWDNPQANELLGNGRFGPTSDAAKIFDPNGYLAVMDEEGITHGYITPTLAMGNFWLPDGQLASALNRAYGRWIREFCAVDPNRLLAFYPINLFDIEQACRDARWAIEEMGFRGFQMVALPIGERAFHHPDFDPFWAVAQDLGVPIQIHSLSALPSKDGKGGLLVDQVAGVKRFGSNLCLAHLTSHRLESHLAILSIVMGGVCERFPGLRFVFVEAGAGWVPSWLEDMDGHFEQQSMARWVSYLRMPPSEYFRRQCLACFNADEGIIGETAPLIGMENVVWSSDYPHHDGVYPGAVEAVASQLDAVSPAERAALLGGNAARFCGLG